MEKYLTLLNKDYPVLKAVYDDELHVFMKITDIYDLNHAPPAILNHTGSPDRRSLNDWWRNRAIPASRNHLAKDFPYLDNVLSLPEQNMGLSLSDRYWMTDRPKEFGWREVNFFDNPFSDDLGVITLGEKQQSHNSSENMFSPNSTLNGDLQKKWVIQDGQRILLKSGSGPFRQEPYNEVVATQLHSALLSKTDFVPYTLQGSYCACPNMLHEDEELIPMWDILRNSKKPNSQNDYQFCISLCEKCGIPRGEVFTHFAKMFLCDFILANHDRHYRNFGLIRNVETLKYTRLAPIYDTGACLWCDKFTLNHSSDYQYIAKPFGRDGMAPKNQIELFRDFEWFDESGLKDFPDKASDVLSQNPILPAKRRDMVLYGLQNNIDDAVEFISELI